MKMNYGLVSIIMPSYNTAKFIAETIESVLLQSYANWELIIVDDCSSDNTDEIVCRYTDRRISYVKNDTNSGAAVSRNRGLRLAKGEWIAFLDSDDIWHRDKLKSQLEFMSKHDYTFSYTKYHEIDEQSNTIGKSVIGPKRITKIKMYAYCWPGCLSVMYHSKTIGLIQIKDLKKNNDYAIWLKAIEKSDCYFLDNDLAAYRKRSGSISNHKKTKLIKYHYDLFREGENFNRSFSILLTMMNLVFGVYQKVRYVKKEVTK